MDFYILLHGFLYNVTRNLRQMVHRKPELGPPRTAGPSRLEVSDLLSLVERAIDRLFGGRAAALSR